jgi:hypothetical protein
MGVVTLAVQLRAGMVQLLAVMAVQPAVAQHLAVLLLAALCGQQCRMIRAGLTTTTRRLV